MGSFAFTWWGHACVEIETPGDKVVLIDPWFGNPKSTKAADEVKRCDLMLVTQAMATMSVIRSRSPAGSARSGRASTNSACGLGGRSPAVRMRRWA